MFQRIFNKYYLTSVILLFSYSLGFAKTESISDVTPSDPPKRDLPEFTLSTDPASENTKESEAVPDATPILTFINDNPPTFSIHNQSAFQDMVQIDSLTSESYEVIQIDPTKARGYTRLPDSIKTLFDPGAYQLSLADVIVELLANNRALTIQGYQLRIAEHELPASRGIYDLLLNAGAGYNRTELRASPDYDHVTGARVRSLDYGASQLVPSGGVLSLSREIIRTNEPVSQLGFYDVGGVSYEQIAALRFTQPLMRGFGSAITNASIRIAQIDLHGASADFESQVTDQLAEAMVSYWNLISAVEQYKVGVIAYASANDLLRVTKVRYEAEDVAKSQLLQAQAAVETRRGFLIRARQQVRDAEDLLKRRIFLQSGIPLWSAEIQPVQPIIRKDISISLDAALDTAMESRAELRKSQSIIERTDVLKEVAKDNVRPKLDLFGQVSENGLAGGYDGAWRDMEDASYTGYGAGLLFEYPLQNRTARHRLKQVELRSLQVESEHQEIIDQIVLEVRAAVRALEATRDRVEATRAAVAAEEAKLDAEEKRLAVDLSTNFEVLLFQQDLAEAQIEQIQAVVEHNIAAIRLERSTGRLLQTYGIEIEGANLNPPMQTPIGFPIQFEK